MFLYINRLKNRYGKCLFDKMKEERITKDEILAASRQKGIEIIDEVKAVFLETDGSLSVISK